MDIELYNRLMKEIEDEEEQPEKKKKGKKKEPASTAVVRNMYEKIPKKML